MTTITVLFFARARELAETSSASVDLDADASPTVAAARARLLELYPQWIPRSCSESEPMDSLRL